MVHDSIVSIAQSWKLIWADLIDWSGSLVSRACNLLIRLEILASTTMDDSIEWRPHLEEIRFVFLDFLGVGSH